MIILMIVGVLHIFWCWLLIDFFNFGVKGSALASLVTSSMNYVLQTLYLFLVVKRHPKLNQAVGLPDKSSFSI
jgi:Na+-driven multidrug efflux pump